MRLKPQQFNDMQMYNCIFNAAYPTITTYPFFKSSRQSLSTLPVVVELKSQFIDNTKFSHRILSDVVVAIKNHKLSQKEKTGFFIAQSTLVNNLIFSEFFKYYTAWREYFDKKILEFAKDKKSKFQWEIAKSIGIDALFSKPYSYEQKMWIVCASYANKRDEQQFWIDMAESLKPWINNELYHQVKKQAENTRTNVKFEQQRKEMLSGSFGISDEDQAIFDKLEADRMEKLTPLSQNDDLDIIR